MGIVEGVLNIGVWFVDVVGVIDVFIEIDSGYYCSGVCVE